MYYSSVVLRTYRCQQKNQHEIIDPAAVQKEATSLMDRYQNAVFSKDLDALSATLAEDGYFLGQILQK